LLDLGLPDSDGLATLRTMQRHAANLPIVVLTGNNDEAAGLDAIREGAQDYLIKGQAGKNQLARSIKYAVERKQAENTIKELNDTLEERILERTAQISLANEALRGEITERKRMEEMLRESERCEHERAEELAVLLEAVPTPVFIASDPDCLHLTGNRLANEILRISCGNELTLSGHRETSPRHFRYFKDGRELRHDELPAHRAASGVPVKDFEFTLVFDDGMVRPVLGYGTPLLDNKGCPRGMVAVLVDITERKQVEEALRQSEENYRELFNTLIEGFCIIEVLFDTNDRPIDYRLLKMNPAFEVQTGLHDAQGKLMRELAPEYEAHWFEILGNVALTGESIRFVNETNAPNRWYDVSAYRVGVQESRKVAILFNDITEVKKAEIALKASEERLALALDGGRMGMWEWDTRLHRAVWNALEYQLLGLPVGEGDVALHLFFGLVHPDDIGPFNEILANVMEYGSDFNHEIRITRADDGQERWLATAGRLIRDAAGQPLKIIGVNYDIKNRLPNGQWNWQPI
jgi:PAS domain-containing protein